MEHSPPPMMTAARAHAVQVVRTLRGAGHVAYLVGGGVRDTLLGLAPKDHDVATSATPDMVQLLFDRAIEVGKSFGVVTIVGPAGEMCEVATFRRDGDYSDGRRPDDVAFGSIEEDASRRDFTINGLYLDPEDGRVIDLVGGRADLQARLVRAIGDAQARFTEDKLRMLRCVRFACRFNFVVEDATWKALCAMSPQIIGVSRERITTELMAMLRIPSRGRALTMLGESGLLAVLLPHLAEALSADGAIGDVMRNEALAAFQMVPNDTPLDDEAAPLLALAALLHPMCADLRSQSGLAGQAGRAAEASLSTAELVRKLTPCLRLSNADMQTLTGTIDLQAALQGAPSLPLASRIRVLRHPQAPAGLALLKLRATVRGELRPLWHSLASARDELERQGRLWPAMPADGRMLQRLGIPAGRAYRDLLEALEDEVLEGRHTTPEQAEQFLRERAREAGLLGTDGASNSSPAAG